MPITWISLVVDYYFYFELHPCRDWRTSTRKKHNTFSTNNTSRNNPCTAKIREIYKRILKVEPNMELVKYREDPCFRLPTAPFGSINRLIERENCPTLRPTVSTHAKIQISTQNF